MPAAQVLCSLQRSVPLGETNAKREWRKYGRGLLPALCCFSIGGAAAIS
jgi:hypothetical protein